MIERKPDGACGPITSCSRTPMPSATFHAGAAELLDVQVPGLERMEVGERPYVAADRLLGFPHPVAPLRVEVAEAAHLEGEHRLEVDRDGRAGVRRERDRRLRGAARAGRPLDRDARRVLMYSIASSVKAPTRHEVAVGVPAPALAVLVDVEVHADVVELDGRPEPEELRQHAGRAALGLADDADAPRAIARAEHGWRTPPEACAVDRERAVPGAELREAGRVHDEAPGDPMGEARLLDRRRAGRERQVGTEAVAVVADAETQHAERLDDLDRDRPDRGLGALDRRQA